VPVIAPTFALASAAHPDIIAHARNRACAFDRHATTRQRQHRGGDHDHSTQIHCGGRRDARRRPFRPPCRCGDQNRDPLWRCAAGELSECRGARGAARRSRRRPADDSSCRASRLLSSAPNAHDRGAGLERAAALHRWRRHVRLVGAAISVLEAPYIWRDAAHMAKAWPASTAKASARRWSRPAACGSSHHLLRHAPAHHASKEIREPKE